MRYQRPPAYTVYLAMSFAGAFAMATLGTLSGVYAVRAAGLNPLQLVLVGTALEATAFVFQVPTGVVADVYSRRLSVIVGYLLAGAGSLLWGSFPRFETILLAQLLWGLGYTFLSGATEAWIADEVGSAQAGRAFIRGAQASQLGAICGIAASVALASNRLSLPILASGVLYLALGLALALLMPERGFRPAPRGERNTWEHWGQTATLGLRTVRGRPVLITILAITFVLGASSEGFDRLNAAHVLENVGLPPLGRFDPIVWFGVISAGGMVLSLLAAEFYRRRLDTSSHTAVARSLFAINALLMVAVAVFGLSGNFALAVGSWWAVTLLRRTNQPLHNAWLNQSLEPEARATVFSLDNQTDALGQIAGGPVVGAIAAGVSIGAGLVVAGALIAPAMLLYARTLRPSIDVAVERAGGR